MCAQSNTSIITIRKRSLLIVAAIVISLISTSFAMAQSEVVVSPLRQSTTRFTNVDLFFYGAGSITKGHIHTANANHATNSDNCTLYNTHVNFGISAEVFRLDLFRLCASLGYIHERYAYERGVANNTGVMAHWICADISVSSSYISIEANTSIFLNSQIKNDDYFSYNGLYKPCFNPATFSVYLGVLYRFSGIKIEARGGVYMPPQFNPDKLAYYNFQSSDIDRFYFEVRLSFRWFHTGRRYKSLNYFQ